MPNTQIQYLDNEIVEGNKVVRFNTYSSNMDIGPVPGYQKFYNGATFATSSADNSPPGLALNQFLVYRRNRIHSNGGFQIGGGETAGGGSEESNILIENSIIRQTGGCGGGEEE